MSVFLPQYAAHAVLDLERWAKQLKDKSAMKIYCGSLTNVASLIRSAVHIILPANGEIYRDNPDGGAIPTQDECDSFVGIPAPIVCFQYQFNKATATLDDNESAASKRITLAVDMKQYENPAGAPRKNDVVLFSVFFSEKHGCWTLGDVAIYLESPLKCFYPENPAGRWHWGYAALARNLATNECHGGEIGLNALDMIYSKCCAEFRPDITAVVQACHALRAGAILDEQQEQSSTRRRKFGAKGVGGFVYHVLKIPGAASEAQEHGGTHASPRLHIRRAHIRKLPKGTLTFVRQCFVGNSETGFVDKHYSLSEKTIRHSKNIT